MCDSFSQVYALRKIESSVDTVKVNRPLAVNRLTMTTVEGFDLEWSAMFGWQLSLEEIRKRTPLEEKSWPKSG